MAIDRRRVGGVTALLCAAWLGSAVPAETGPPGRVQVSVRQAVYTNEGESAANRLLADYRVDATQEGREVSVVGRRKTLLSWARWRHERVELTATVGARTLPSRSLTIAPDALTRTIMMP